MKTDLVDVNETRKHLRVEIPSEIVDDEIERLTLDYARKAKIPGFRPGKAPARVVKQRFKEQILHDVAHDLVPRALDDAMRTRGVEPIETPDVRDVTVNEGQALTFTASFDTLPAFEPGDYEIDLRRHSARVEDAAVDQALERLRARAARFEPVTDRGLDHGDTAIVDLVRQEARAKAEHHTDVTIELGAKGNPPGFDVELHGLTAGTSKAFVVHYPSDYPVGELAGSDVSYTVTVKDIKRRVLPELDDELAKDLGDDTLVALRARVQSDLEREAQRGAERALRGDLLQVLAARVTFEVPATLVDREIDRRLDDFARRLIEQGMDPRQSGIDWRAFRESQREPAREAVKSALVLEEIARRERLDPTEGEIAGEIARYAEQNGRTVVAVRAALERDGGLARVTAGLRREKSIDFLLSRARIAPA
jgi:trigger factor